MFEDLQFYLINAAHEHFITKTGKKSKTGLKILWSREAEGLRTEGQHMRRRTESRKK